MKDYSKMSDFEINKAVSTALGMDVSGATEENNIMYGYVPNICNNPSDAWPIIFQNDIMLNPSCADSLWKAEQGLRVKPSGFYSVATAYDTNPLRAAMIVYLMMKDEEK